MRRRGELHLPEHSRAAQELRGFLDFESHYAAGTDSLSGRFATGAFSFEDPTLAPQVADLTSTWRGPRADVHVILAGDPARRIEHRDFVTRRAPRRLCVPVLVAGDPSPTMFTMAADAQVEITVLNTGLARSFAGATAELDELHRHAAGEPSRYQPFAREALAAYTLAATAALETTTHQLSIGTLPVAIPALQTRGRFLYGAAEFRHTSFDLRDLFARRRTAINFVAAMAPTLHGLMRQRRTTLAELQQLPRTYPELFGVHRATTPDDHYAAEHIAHLLEFSRRFSRDISDVTTTLHDYGTFGAPLSERTVRSLSRDLHAALAPHLHRGVSR